MNHLISQVVYSHVICHIVFKYKLYNHISRVSMITRELAGQKIFWLFYFSLLMNSKVSTESVFELLHTQFSRLSTILVSCIILLCPVCSVGRVSTSNLYITHHQSYGSRKNRCLLSDSLTSRNLDQSGNLIQLTF